MEVKVQELPFVSSDVINRPYTGMRSGRTSGPGALPVRKRKKKLERVYKSDRYWSHRSRTHIPKPLHAPRKSLKLPRSEAKKRLYTGANSTVKL